MTVSKPLTLAALGAAALSTSWAPALAQTPCGERQEIVTSLEQRFDETPVGIGLMQPGRVLELLVSESGSWTLLVTLPNGRSCIVSAGEHWEGSTIPVKGEPI